MYQINIHQAKTQFSKLVDAAYHGNEIIIAKAGVLVAKLVSFEEKISKRKLGILGMVQLKVGAGVTKSNGEPR